MRARGSKSGGKTRPQNHQKLENLLGRLGFSSPEIQFSLLVIQFFSLAFQFSSMAFQFSSTAFQLLSMAFCFPQCLSAFRNACLLSATVFQFSSTAFRFSSTAFRFPRNPRKSIYGGKYTKDLYSNFVFPATCSPRFVVRATMSTSPPTLIASNTWSSDLL
jgi:hypothetical protein